MAPLAILSGVLTRPLLISYEPGGEAKKKVATVGSRYVRKQNILFTLPG